MRSSGTKTGTENSWGYLGGRWPRQGGAFARRQCEHSNQTCLPHVWQQPPHSMLPCMPVRTRKSHPRRSGGRRRQPVGPSWQEIAYFEELPSSWYGMTARRYPRRTSRQPVRLTQPGKRRLPRLVPLKLPLAPGTAWRVLPLVRRKLLCNNHLHGRAGVAELADAADSKSAEACPLGGSIPPSSTILKLGF